MPGPESKIQTSVVKYARSKGVVCIKQGGSRFLTAGWPDYLMLYAGRVLAEFKKPGGVCTPLQLQRHAELRAVKIDVIVIDDVLVGRQRVDFFISGRKTL